MNRIPVPPGHLYNLDGYRLHLQCQGDGQPAAVMDSGLGGNSLFWTNALPVVARLTRACAFDRAGYAWSDPAPPDVMRTSRNIVEELRRLLEAAGNEPPYILVGHSFGAINMLVYAYTYPQEVVGLVLVDPSHPEMFTRVPGVPSPKAMQRSFQMIASLGKLGLLRWIGPRLARQVLPDGPEALPAETWQAAVAFLSQAKEYQTAGREAQQGVENFAAARGSPGSLGDLPLEVLSADFWVTGKQTPMKQAVLLLRDEQAALSTRGHHRIVEHCDHTNLPVVQPDAVAEAIRRVLELVESHALQQV